MDVVLTVHYELCFVRTDLTGFIAQLNKIRTSACRAHRLDYELDTLLSFNKLIKRFFGDNYLFFILEPFENWFWVASSVVQNEFGLLAFIDGEGFEFSTYFGRF